MITIETSNVLNNLPGVLEVAKLLAISFSSYYFAHIQYIPKEYLGWKSLTIDESNILKLSEYAATSANVPEGAKIVKEIKENQLPHQWSLTHTQGRDWVAQVHTDGPSRSSSGGLPIKGIIIPGTEQMNREEAISKGIDLRLFFR